MNPRPCRTPVTDRGRARLGGSKAGDRAGLRTTTTPIQLATMNAISTTNRWASVAPADPDNLPAADFETPVPGHGCILLGPRLFAGLVGAAADAWDRLLLKALGDLSLVLRLIGYELKRCPGLALAEAVIRANDRWERDLSR